MTHSARLTVLGTAALAIVALGACRKTPPAIEAEPAVPSINQDSINRVRDAAAADEARRRADQARQDSIANAAALGSQQQAEMVATLGNVVYFDYDDATISAQGRAVLDSKIPILLANSSLTIRVAGHTDERGSAEYNLALAQRRAIAVKGYLSTRGVSSNRIEAVSYGEEYPVAEGSMESAWSLNRRAEFEITSPATPLARPRP
ncbi:MAG: OmpA family protein [Gemmatimonadaceae bacterium]|nr:OmpA family protein [Gemmatimonadaceae bacterium]